MLEGKAVAIEDNPFADVFMKPVDTVEEVFKSLPPRTPPKVKQDATNLLKQGQTLAKLGRVSKGKYATPALVLKARELAQKIVVTMSALIKQAFELAVFKFVIELCAMILKSVIETMSGLSLKIPNIDTSGIYYNNGPAAPSAATTGQQTQSSARYDNPFSTVFPSGMAAW